MAIRTILAAACVLTAALLQPPIDAAVKYGALKQSLDANQIVADSRPFWSGVK